MSKLAEEIVAEVTAEVGLASPQDLPLAVAAVDRVLEQALFPPGPPPAPDYVPKQKRPMPVTPVEVAQEAARYRAVQARLAMRRGNYEEALRWLGDAVTACRDVKREMRAAHEGKQAAADAELLLSRKPTGDV